MSETRGTLLVVDDAEMNRDMLSRRLCRQGFDVRLAASGAEALAIVAARPIALVLLDVEMPGMSGLDVLQRLRQQYSRVELPIIMVTARQHSQDMVDALSMGANDYITKPVDFPVALARIQTQLALQQRDALRTARLEASERQLQQAQALAHVGSWEWDIRTGEARWSDEQFRMFGVAPDACTPSVDAYLELVTPEDRERMQHLLHRASEGEPFECEHGVATPQGDVRIVHVCASVVSNPRGEPVRVIGAAQDITTRRSAEQALQEKTAALEHAAQGIARLDAEGRFVSVNGAYAEMLRYPPSDLVGTHWHRTIRTDDLPDVLHAYSRMCAEGKSEVQARGLRSDGSEFHTEAVLIGVGGEGARSGHYLIVRDISERKRIEHELATARDTALHTARLQAEFLANMSHEIRTPMNGVVGMIGLLLDTTLAAEQREFVQTMQGSADDLLTIINDILDFSKIEAGKLSLESIEFDLLQSVESAVDLLAVPAHAKHLELVTWIDEDVPSALQGDPGRFRQVLMNLLSNAVKFTERGEVVVRITRERETDTQVLLRVAVTDTGIGIPADVQTRLFKAFSQGDGSTTRRFGGTGLGLAISQQLVHMMGGAIRVSSAPARGSTFWFIAPFAKAAVSTLTTVRQPGPLAGVKALVVHGHGTTGNVLQRQLANWGMLADRVGSGAEALVALRAAVDTGRSFDVVLLDMTVSTEEGCPLAGAIRAEPAIAGVSLVVMAPLGQHTGAAALQPAGGALLLTKPVKRQQLFERVTASLGTTTHRQLPAIAVESAAVAVAPPDEQKASDHVTPISRGRVLLADDNPVNQRVALHQLKRLGYEVHAVGNGAAAVSAAALLGPFDLVFMDCQMPELDGYAATELIREAEGAGRRTPIIALTAHALHGEREKCMRAGMDDYLSKPVKLDELEAMSVHWMNRLLPLGATG